MATQPTPIHCIEVSDERLRPRPGFAIEDRLLGWDNAEHLLAHTARNLDLVKAARAEVAASHLITLHTGSPITACSHATPNLAMLPVC